MATIFITNEPFEGRDALVADLRRQGHTVASTTDDKRTVFARRLLEAQDAERRYVVRELHDDLGELLTAVSLALESSESLAGDAARGEVRRAQSLVRDLIARVHESSLRLRPPMLDDLGVLPAILTHVERYQMQTGVSVTLQHTGVNDRRFAAVMENAVYRIVQEALTNVARHARVNTVTVRLWTTEDALHVQIQDQGAGFDPEAMPRRNWGGLAGMRERTRLLGGELIIESGAGQGTTLIAHLPLEAGHGSPSE